MTDYELHREEWIEERAAILEHEGKHDPLSAWYLAKTMWLQHQADRIQAQERSGAPQ